MKNLYLIIALSIGAFGQAQIINIPDANFKNALVNTLCVDTNGDGTYDSNADINNDGEIDLFEAESIVFGLRVIYQNISSLDGIQYFINLQRLNCGNNNISDLSLNNNVNLEWLACEYNQIINLDLSENQNLKTLYCGNNQMVNLNLSNANKLRALHCSNNNIENIDISDCIELVHIYADNNNLESFDIGQSPIVDILMLRNNNLTTLNIKNNYTRGLSYIKTGGNPNLGCIQVDDINYPATRNCSDNHWCTGPPLQNPNSYYSEDCSLGTAEFGNLEFSIYPNPVKDVLTVNSQESIDFLKIYSTNGKLLKEATESSINVSELASGLYFVMVSIDGSTDTKKFIKN